MRRVNGDYVRRFNIRHQRVGRLWRGRYKAILVEEGAYLRECSRYIHLDQISSLLNRAKITRPAERYRWSSYRSYVGYTDIVPWVDTRAVLAGFGRDREEGKRSDRYRAYGGRQRRAPDRSVHAGCGGLGVG